MNDLFLAQHHRVHIVISYIIVLIINEKFSYNNNNGYNKLVNVVPLNT